MRFLLLLVLLPAIMGISPVPPASTKSIVTISYINAEDKEMRCTGFQVDMNRVLTAEHCVPPVDGKGEIYVEGLVSRVVDRTDSLALLDVPVTDRIPFVVAKTLPKPGDPLTSYGYAFGGPLMQLARNVAGYMDGHLIVDNPIAGGMSGGPVLNSNGEVVGINQAANDIFGIACTLKEIRDFLK